MPPGLRESYDRVAEAYADHFRDELDHKPSTGRSSNG
jgi:hypothetical protein